RHNPGTPNLSSTHSWRRSSNTVENANREVDSTDSLVTIEHSDTALTDSPSTVPRAFQRLLRSRVSRSRTRKRPKDREWQGQPARPERKDLVPQIDDGGRSLIGLAGSLLEEPVEVTKIVRVDRCGCLHLEEDEHATRRLRHDVDLSGSV